MSKRLFKSRCGRLLPLAAALGLAGAVACRADAPTPLTAQKPVLIPGGAGGFDWMMVDAPMHRVFASHKGTKSTAVVDTRTGRALPSAPCGTAQGLAVDTTHGTIFAGDEEEKTVVVLDRRTLAPLGQVPVTGPVDAVAYDPTNGTIYADRDDGKEVWVIDARTRTLVGSVPISGAPEFLQYSPGTDRLYQAVKTTDTVAVINPKTNRVEAAWPTAPVTAPHGLAIDEKTHRLFIAGGGKLAVLDLRTGKVLGAAPIAEGVDQIAFDPGRRRVYCACGRAGVISVVQETAGGVTRLADVPSAKGAHTLAVDPQTHSVWICYTDAADSYLQEYVPR